MDGEGARGFVIADRSRGGLSPVEWAQRAVNAYHEFAADRIVVEVNQGGDMVRSIVAQVDPSVPVREVRATRGKRLRAEPIAALYESKVVYVIWGASPLLKNKWPGLPVRDQKALIVSMLLFGLLQIYCCQKKRVHLLCTL